MQMGPRDKDLAGPSLSWTGALSRRMNSRPTEGDSYNSITWPNRKSRPLAGWPAGQWEGARAWSAARRPEGSSSWPARQSDGRQASRPQSLMSNKDKHTGPARYWLLLFNEPPLD